MQPRATIEILAQRGSAELYSGVSQDCILPRAQKVPRSLESERPADWQSARNRTRQSQRRSTPAVLELLFLFAFVLSGAAPVSAKEQSVCLSRYSAQEVELTADPSSAFWKDVPPVVMNRSVLGEEKPQLEAAVRSRWTRDSLYLLFVGHYVALTLKPNPVTTNETDRLWLHDCFEAYVQGDPAATNRYREFQMSPQGEFLDLDIDSAKPRPGYNNERLWNSGMQVKARIDETNKLWCGEMRIPMSAIASTPPRPGKELRANFCRQDGVGRNRDFLAWQPTGAWTPHRPEMFGTLRLVANR